MNVCTWLARTAKIAPHSPALLSGETLKATYNDFALRAASMAATFRTSYGIREGDRIALFMSNCTEYLEVLYGAWWAGAAVVPINAKLHPKEAAWILQDAQATLAFISDNGGDALYGQLDDCKTLREVISTDRSEFTALYNEDPLSKVCPKGPNDLAWLFYTSGTTGRPKGVMITHANLAAMTHSYFADVDTVERDGAKLYAAPMSHGAGLYNFMFVLKGARHVVPEQSSSNPQTLLNLSRSLRNVSMFLAPTMVRRLVDQALNEGSYGDGIKTIVYGGGPMYLADIKEAMNVMGQRFVQIYGQGESPMTITALSRNIHADMKHPRWEARLSSVGIAQSCVEIQIGNPDGGLLSPGQIGEVLVRGPSVMAGYWRQPAATADTLREGWLWTGDMGSLDEDGFLTLHDRSKDIIISGGSNIYPREVEETLLLHPDVLEVSVVGRPHPDWGEDVVAFVVMKPGRNMDPSSLDRICLENIARFKRPKTYLQETTLPKNNYGKVLKTELRSKLMQKRPPN